MRINSVLITGANRGLGLEFVKQFLKLSSPPTQVFATCRNPSQANVSTKNIIVSILLITLIYNYLLRLNSTVLTTTDILVLELNNGMSCKRKVFFFFLNLDSGVSF